MKAEVLNKYVHPIHKEGYIFIIIALAATILLYQVSDFFGHISLVLSLFVIYFFRDPVRVVPQVNNLVVSGADGYVIDITKVRLPAELDAIETDEVYRISTFLSVLDVHVNRTPIEGIVKKIVYNPGKFLSAELNKASEENERNSLLIQTEDNREVAVVQIAGLIARRIKCIVKEDEKLEKGQRIGIIRFGSRVDVYLPNGIIPKVAIGQKVVGGETILADINESEGREILGKEI
ncbi:MAG TPA: phosphatidylserine decarboxylase family protein [Alphaproteobacteria bacterium]|nr:phosphatidylserine decarboxylase family protein [Alphaproteobacteria bacterium]